MEKKGTNSPFEDDPICFLHPLFEISLRHLPPAHKWNWRAQLFVCLCVSASGSQGNVLEGVPALLAPNFLCWGPKRTDAGSPILPLKASLAAMRDPQKIITLFCSCPVRSHANIGTFPDPNVVQPLVHVGLSGSS